MTGLQVAEYAVWLGDVLPLYRQAEPERLARPNRQREAGGGREARLGAGDQIRLTVVWLRQYPVHEGLAYRFGTSSPAVSRYVAHVLPVLEQAGKDTMRMPDPGRKRRRSLAALLTAIPALGVVIDSFEQKVQRPADSGARDALYSGKKTTHTLTSQVTVDEATGASVAVSDSLPGPRSDVKRVEHSSGLERLPEGVGAIGDCGYQGIHDLHPLADAPRKKPRGKNRPADAAAYTTAFARRRLMGELSRSRKECPKQAG